MSRTLRGFDTEFPYLGDQGDINDDELIDAEEAYGYEPDDEYGFFYGDAYGADAEGEDDDELLEHEGDVEESGKFKLFQSAPWLIPAAAGVGAGILGTAAVTSLIRKKRHRRDTFGAIGDTVAGEFGAQKPPGYTIDSRGALKKISRSPGPSKSSKAAAMAAHKWFFNNLRGDSTIPSEGFWAPGDTWYTSIPLSQHSYAAVDRNMQQLGQQHGVNVIRANPKSGGTTTYLFTDSPKSSVAWYKLQGYTLKPVHIAS